MYRVIEIQQVPVGVEAFSICTASDFQECTFQLVFHSDASTHKLLLYLIVESKHLLELQQAVHQAVSCLSIRGYKVCEVKHEDALEIVSQYSHICYQANNLTHRQICSLSCF